MTAADSAPPIPQWVKTLDGIAFSEIPVIPGDRLPSFMVIGAAKAGTTALNLYLSRHPQIFMCPLKEPHFFSTDHIYERGLDWYQGLYADAQPEQICGEASTSYTFFPNTPLTSQRLYQVLPDIKLIYLVREPVSRVESACLQSMKYQQYVLNDSLQSYTVDRLVELGEDPYNALGLPNFIQASQYITQIEQYLQFFSRDQLLVILQEDLADDPDTTLRTIFAFIGVEPAQFPAIAASTQANATAAMIQGFKAEQLSDKLRFVPGYDRLKQLVPDRLKQSIKRIHQTLTPDDQVVHLMSQSLKDRLTTHFFPYNQALADYLQRDLSHWRS